MADIFNPITDGWIGGAKKINAQFNIVQRNFSFNEGLTLAADYYPSNTSINAIVARNIATLEYSTDGSTFTTLALPAGLPLAVAAGDLYWRITYSNGKTQAFLYITGSK